jgi:hypothetical protein
MGEDCPYVESSGEGSLLKKVRTENGECTENETARVLEPKREGKP